MSNVFIPLGGAGGKNRGNSFYISDTAPTAEILGRIITPLPAGVYKKFVTPDGQVVFPSADGGDAVVSMSKEFLKKQAIKTFGIASITNFSLTMYAHRQVRLTWAKPDRGLWSGTRFVFKYGSMPTSETDGFMVYDSADVHYETARLEERELFVRAFNYVTVRDGRWYDEGTVSAKITVTGISGSVTLGAGAGTWTVPAGVTRIRFILVGQGGEGCTNSGWRCGGAGGGGGYFKQGYMNVTPGQGINWIVPTANQGLVVNSKDWQDYNKGLGHLAQLDTVFGNERAEHGRHGRTDWSYGYSDELAEYGGVGGSGGGAGNSGVGGRNGGNGSDTGRGITGTKYKKYQFGGTGSHQSTTGFNGVLYCTGGNGGPPDWGETGARGTDGLGTGGNGAGGYYRHSLPGGLGGTGCIYIAWGSAMNDGT